MADNRTSRYGDEFCKVDPAPLHSEGVWDLEHAKAFLTHDLLRLHLQLIVIFILSQSLYLFFSRFRLPRFVSELAAGIILGPSVMGAIFPGFVKTLFPESGYSFLDPLSKIGFMFFMFLIGVKMDTSLVMKSGKKAWTIAVTSVVIPVLTGILFSIFIPVGAGRKSSARFLIGVQTLSPFPVIARLLIDLNIMNSELGRLALASSLIRDLLNTTASTLINYLRVWAFSMESLLAPVTLSLCVGFVLVVLFVLRPLFLWIIRQTPEGKPVKGMYIIFICFVVIFSAIISDNLGIQYQFGPFILGLTVPVGPPLGSTLEKRLDTIILGLLTPTMVSCCGMGTDLLEIYDVKFVTIVWVIVFLGTLSKVIAVIIPAMACKMPFKDATALALMMSTQGIVELASYLMYRQNQTLDEEDFSAAVLSVLATALVIPFLVNQVYDYSRIYIGFQKRNILHLTNTSELRILGCAHRQDEALACITLLEASNPTKESPISVFALHLVELVGRASPLLINHQLHQKSASSIFLRSEPIIEAFEMFQQRFPDSVTVQSFTAMSMRKFMVHDICLLAFDKLASLIVLPFHKKWNSHGKMILNNLLLKTLNNQVLDMAPCSVGILVDRRRVQAANPSRASAYRVVVIFLGGDDDQEALAYAKRMARGPEVHLTVLRLVPWEDRDPDNWETILDAECLKDVRLHSSARGNLVYKEEMVRDGPDTALLIHSMEESYDLIMVGRRHRSGSPQLTGLAEWTECPELGVIGDLLASSEVDKPVSVLVVQQQNIKRH